jgi:HD-like signal output (HDOD) protein
MEMNLAQAGNGFNAAVFSVPDKLAKMPPLSPAALKLLNLSSESDVEIKQYVQIIEADPMLTAEVLQLANSPLFGFTTNVHVLGHAITLVGPERIKTLAVTAAMKAYTGGGRSAAMRVSWKHSLACGLLCREIARFFKLSEDRCYTVGLMHDIGRLGLIKSFAPQYDQILAPEYVRSDEVIRVESTMLGIDHCQAGYWLTRTWGFPAGFSEVSARHHDAFSEGQSELLQVVQVGCMLADCLGFAAVRWYRSQSCEQILSQVPRLPVDAPEWSEEKLREKITDKIQSAAQ